ncbi:hypothetical protein CY0110_30136 [Crocosphaera chwakensis CCY0110]|uniref:Uncharacterized protein n=1 Tax=Crocosphaera chwakensis CCY0110 TaxID=391612 RepID=A3IRS6_9CHRO|nr:hypothetical protein CY0110_30136 [Crocosphaera chwakensis CCY0110]
MVNYQSRNQNFIINAINDFIKIANNKGIPDDTIYKLGKNRYIVVLIFVFVPYKYRDCYNYNA